MEEEKKPRKKTRWGCLSLLIIPTVLFALARLHDIHYENQPLEVHLRDIFKESGFKVPEDATDLTGDKGFVDFQGDFGAHLSFKVKPEEVEAFMKLNPKYWSDPGSFQPIKKVSTLGRFSLSPGAYAITQEGPGDYRCMYAVDPKACWIYFDRSSW
jgi:hypothetical protein